MNNCHPYSDNCKPLKAGFGINPVYERQKEVLPEMKSEIIILRVVGGKYLLPFQKGILVSTSSLLGLHEDLKQIGIKYILTTRLTQDALESLFSKIRGIGHFYDHPSPSEFSSRLKHLLLANKLPNLSTEVNIECAENRMPEM